MKVRLVVYRKETSSSTATTAFDLDLQEEPNVALNYQFSDIKEPATRKASYSQTFKLPFTDRNNEFFQNWYNVNLDTLVFSSRTKFEAVLYVGTTPQFEGYLQLKSVYKKAQLYEAVLMSNTATLFSTIGEQRLKEVFREDDGSYNTNFNHVFNETNFENSWGVGVTSSETGLALYDSTIGISRIVYPISVTRPNFYWWSLQDLYLNMDQTSANTIVTNDGVESAYNKSVSLSQFRPAIQIRTLLNMLIARAGFTYTSNFLDSADFGKIFMTTCNHLEVATATTTNNTPSLSGVMSVIGSYEWGNFSDDFTSAGAGTVIDSVEAIVEANLIEPIGNCSLPADPDNVWNNTYNYFTKKDSSMSSVQFSSWLRTQAIQQVQNPGAIDITVDVVKFDTSTNTSTGEVISSATQTIQTATAIVSGTPCQSYDFWLDLTADISQMSPNSSAQLIVRANNLQWTPGTVTPIFSFAYTNNFNCDTYTIHSSILIEWAGYATDIYGATIDIPSCIDPEITQKAFLKDLIQRFNLVILTDPNDDTNLLIEPYNDFVASGQIKDWTNKLDTSKEIIVKDTTQIQKKTIHLTDQEDEDLYNKSIKERYEDINVFGHLKIDQFNNDFATGELKNESIFSPFINGQVFCTPNEQLGTQLKNMAVHYEFSYDEGSGGILENKVTKTKPKLFWYNGEATYTQNVAGDTKDYYLHRTTSSGITAFDFNSYPVCTPFNITPGSGSNPANQYTLTTTNTSLYWNATPPLVGNLTVFNYTGDYGNWFNKTLYGKYWKAYLDNIYSTEARIMECYLNLNEVDIFNFSFADEIFIKDTYWRILNISNYQVGEKASTKVKLIKSLDSKENCAGCDYVTGSVGNTNLYAGDFYLWCPDDNPDCTPDITSLDLLGLYANPECCACNGGWTAYNMTDQASNGLYPCFSLAGSLPINLKSIFGTTSLFNSGQLKTLLNDKIGGLDRPKITGTANDKYATPIMPYYGDDMIIKYKSKNVQSPSYEGESHKLVLGGYTEGNTRGYAYPQNDSYSTPLYMPPNVNIAIRLTGISSVVGGTSATYALGSTETFGYYTAFVILSDRTVQMGTSGGVEEFSIREGANPTTCTMHIDIDSEGLLRFGLDDSQTDTKRTWNITAEIQINRIGNLSIGFDENWALFQNGQKIKFQNGDYLIWN